MGGVGSVGPVSAQRLNNSFLTAMGWCFFCGSVMFFLSCVCCAFVLVCLFVPCGRLLALVCGVLL